MEEQLIKSLIQLCEDIHALVGEQRTKIEHLEQVIEELTGHADRTYSQSEFARKTGWSTAAINNWVHDGTITPVMVGTVLRIPDCEVKKILTLKGPGKKKRAA